MKRERRNAENVRPDCLAASALSAHANTIVLLRIAFVRIYHGNVPSFLPSFTVPYLANGGISKAALPRGKYSVVTAVYYVCMYMPHLRGVSFTK